MINSYS